MRKSQRLLDIWLYINQKKNFTAQEVADYFDISVRTVFRDLDDLSAMGVPIYSEVGRNGGFSILDNTILPPITFSEEEIASIFFTYQALRYYQDIPYQAQIEIVRNKLLEQVSKQFKEKLLSMENYISMWSPLRQEKNTYLRGIFHASIEKQPLVIQYNSKEGIREFIVIPIGIYSYNGFWYFPAWYMKKQTYRLFRVDRVQQISYVEDQIEVPKDLWNLTQWQTSIKKHEMEQSIVIKVTREGYRTITNSWLLKGNTEWTDDYTLATITATCPHSQLKFVVPDIFKLGVEAKVISPKSIQDELLARAKQVKAMYE
ncbi:YafY family protein [Priestia megaterium]|uniref:helix-turn-helix transcriptional regulator n=1 Tax=Priestia megaterium TaxID=1404 RepID=UPI002FE12884